MNIPLMVRRELDLFNESVVTPRRPWPMRDRDACATGCTSRELRDLHSFANFTMMVFPESNSLLRPAMLLLGYLNEGLPGEGRA